MAVTATITKITKDADGTVRFLFGKVELVFNSIAEARNFARDVLADRATLQATAIALMLTRQPNLTNPSLFDGHSVTVDFAQTNWGTIS